MSRFLTERETYSRAETVSDTAVHILGLLVVAACVPVLVVVAAYSGEGPYPITATLVYGGSFAAMIVCSALYNVFPHPEWEWLLRRLDHSAIYIKIAGTFTGFALLFGQGLWAVTVLWGIASGGIALKVLLPFRLHWLALLLYLGMGWFGALAFQPVFAHLPFAALALIGAGGTTYTVGVGFYLWKSLKFHLTIWHTHVLLASLMLYAAVVITVLA